MPFKRIVEFIRRKKPSPSNAKDQKLFPFARETKVKKWGSITIHDYEDGSRRYELGDGNFMVVTAEGMKKYHEDPRARKRFFNNPRQHLASGGNSDVYLTTVSEQPAVVKVHHNGISPLGQLGNMRQIRKILKQTKRDESAPTYYAAGQIIGPNNHHTKQRISVMEHIKGVKVELLQDRLSKSKSKADHKLAQQLRIEYIKFENRIKRYGIDLTDLHEGNVLVEYDEKRKKFHFGLIDQ